MEHIPVFRYTRRHKHDILDSILVTRIESCLKTENLDNIFVDVQMSITSDGIYIYICAYRIKNRHLYTDTHTHRDKHADINLCIFVCAYMYVRS